MKQTIVFFKQTFSKARRFFRQIRGFFPEALPVGMTEFNAWADSVADTYALPTADRDSVRFTLATIIMHLGPTTAYRSKFHFVLMFKAAASKQIAGGVFYEIKEKQKSGQQAQAAATAQTAVTANGKQAQVLRDS